MRPSHLPLAALVVCSTLSILALPAAAQLTPSEIEALTMRGQAEGWTFEVGENEATQYPLEQLCGLSVPSDWAAGQRFDPCYPERDLPSALDYRAWGCCPGVRNQGGCGSCWAFGTVGAMECNLIWTANIWQDLSEQYLVSCNSDGWSCSGGWWAHDYHVWKADSCGGVGAVRESSFPYVGWNAPCSCPFEHPYQLLSWSFIGDPYTMPTVDQLKQAIQEHGPVAVTVTADSAFQGYRSGIFNACTTSPINHAVVLVGWCDDAQGGYWIMRNSWGSGWGEDGYMRIRYNCSNIGYAATYVIYQPFKVTGHVRYNDGTPMCDVTLDGYPHPQYTDLNGFFLGRVASGTTLTITPAKPGYAFDPPSRTCTNITGNIENQDFVVSPLPHIISGHVRRANGTPVAGVTIEGLPGNPQTDEDGFYTGTVYGCWTGLLRPVKTGWTFQPHWKYFENLVTDATDQDFIGEAFYAVISGYILDDSGAPAEGVGIMGLPGCPVTDGDGYYVAWVEYGWSGTATPSATCRSFTPPSRTYQNVDGSSWTEDYTAAALPLTVSGRVHTALGVPVGGVTMLGLEGNPVTDNSGEYTANVICEWSGTCTPTHAAFTFEPPSISYMDLVEPLAEQDYVAARAFPLGDMNCDGAVNFGDINPFVLAMSNPEGYVTSRPSCTILNADINDDGQVGFGDISPFVNLLSQP